jgi:hypothetical protein
MAPWSSTQDAAEPALSRGIGRTRAGSTSAVLPQRAVIVERRDAFGLGYKLGRSLFRDALNEIHDSFFDCRIVPRWQRISRRCGLGLRGNDQERSRQDRKHRYRREQSRQGGSSPRRVARFHTRSLCQLLVANRKIKVTFGNAKTARTRADASSYP